LIAEKREHETSNGADCWCEPIAVGDDATGRVFIHFCGKCERGRCICPENIIEGEDAII
jgi:hypothetical protein